MNKYSVRLEETKFSADELEAIDRAVVMAAEAHEGQLRKSGEPYVTHPVAVAQLLADWGMDTETILAGLLHDTVEDTPVKLSQIESEFGPAVAALVDGVTKLGQVDLAPFADGQNHRQAISSENIRKLLLAMTKDLRVIIVKLADRLHNVKTLRYLDADRQKRIATETLEIYAPLADRLGMGQLKSELEDLSFRYAMPTEYQEAKKLMAGYVRKSEHYISHFTGSLKRHLEESGIKVVSIDGRQKHLYSVYKKLAKSEGDIAKIYDLVAVRVIVPNESDCYHTMGLIHQYYKPLIYRIKDYIAVPKPNGYRSLHTTVFGIDGRITEVQIRTPQMHDEAERGLAAHFYYDSQKTTKAYKRGQSSSLPKELNWVNRLSDLNAAIKSGSEFVEVLKVDLFHDRIFILSPRGDAYDLPESSTPVDFAFAVHSDVGLRAQGAKVNGRIVPLDHKLENRDVVEIMMKRQPGPNRDWLTFVRTPGARQKIRAWFRNIGREGNITSGKQSLEEAIRVWGVSRLDELPADKLKQAAKDLNLRDADALLAAIGDGTVSVGQATRRLFPPAPAKPKIVVPSAKTTGKVVVKDTSGLSYQLALCCKPVWPTDIIGYVTRGSGVTVHRVGCGNVPDEPDRLAGCRWELESEEGLLTSRVRLKTDVPNPNLGAITRLASEAGCEIKSIRNRSREDKVVDVELVTADLYTLSQLIKKMYSIAGIKSVQKID